MRKLVVIFSIAAMSGVCSAQTLFKQELNLPVRGLSQRATTREVIPPGGKYILFEEEGPGCIFHWWMTYSPQSTENRAENFHWEEFILKIYYEDEEVPTIDMPLGYFFSILQDKYAYPIDNAAIKVLPKNALNCYFPLPFEKCRIELENNSKGGLMFWFQADWQEYNKQVDLPYRLHAYYNAEFPADPAGSYLMADITGEGFLAGFTKALIIKDSSDYWFHSGGDLIMIDGEDEPRAIRGIGGEDAFHMAFGVWDVQTEWVGTPVFTTEKPYSGERVMYRIYGPCPIWFNESVVMRFGSKANDIESVVYAYVKEKEAKHMTTIDEWFLAGPFPCADLTEFNKAEWPEQAFKNWPDEHVADFVPFIGNLNYRPKGPITYKVPIETPSEHGWCDFGEHYRGRQRANQGTQAEYASAYATGFINIEEAGDYELIIGYDDWIKIWIDDELIHTGRNDKGFEVDKIRVKLPESNVEIKIKLSNMNNFQWRLWAFNLKLRKF